MSRYGGDHNDCYSISRSIAQEHVASGHFVYQSIQVLEYEHDYNQPPKYHYLQL